MSTYTEFRSRYTFGNQGMLGEGGYGVVYRAYDTVLDRTVAIKMSPVKDGQAYTLQREVEVAGTLPMHPNIARYEPPTYRFEIEGLSVYDFALMQYYPDGNLAQYVAAHNPAGEELHALVAGILAGIAFLHSGAGKPVIVHRDLKPSNILIIRRPDGVPVPKIADFGLAKASESGKSLSNSGGAFTAQYMSPEQAQYGSLDWRSDLWSVGSILYFLCTGQHAFTAPATADAEQSMGGIIEKISQGQCPPLAKIAEPYRSMIAACWVVDRNQRIQSATALLEMLGGAPTPNPIDNEEDDIYNVAEEIAEIRRLLDADQREAALAKCQAGLRVVPGHPVLQQLEAELKPLTTLHTPNIAEEIEEIRHLRDAGQREKALSKCRAALLIVPGHLVLQQLKAELEAPPIAEEQPVINPEPGGADGIGFPKPIPSNSPRRKRLLLIGSAAALVVVAGLFFIPDWGGKRAAEREHIRQQRVADSLTAIKNDSIQRAKADSIARFRALPEPIQELVAGMVRIPGGTFMMGSNHLLKHEKPVHSVSVGSFYMGSTEVTQAQYKAVMGSNPSKFKGCDQCPVEQVSWNDAQKFIKKMNQLTAPSRNSLAYRLPTEAEWEYAAGGGNGNRTIYAGTSSEGSLGSYAWYDGNSSSKTHPVKSKSPNALGLYDMGGNVCEWCQDWYEGYPGSNDVINYSGSERAVRGGMWFNSPIGCSVAFRGSISSRESASHLGFRLARTL